MFVWEWLGMFGNGPECSRMVENVLEWLGMFVWEWSGMFQNVEECSFGNGQESLGMFQNGCLGMVRNP